MTTERAPDLERAGACAEQLRVAATLIADGDEHTVTLARRDDAARALYALGVTTAALRRLGDMSPREVENATRGARPRGRGGNRQLSTLLLTLLDA